MQNVWPALITALFLCSCGATGTIPPALPENIGAEPRGTIGIIAVPPSRELSTALRAIGVPHTKLPIGYLDDAQLDGLTMVILDEGALDDPVVPQALPRLYDHARTMGLTLFILAQQPERAAEVMRSSAGPIEPRAVDYDVTLVAPQRDHRSLGWPNAILQNDLEEFAERTMQFARGRNGRAILAGNVDRPDSSAAILRVPYGKGAIWYVAFPFVDFAADGHPADQRMLGNLVSVD